MSKPEDPVLIAKMITDSESLRERSLLEIEMLRARIQRLDSHITYYRRLQRS